VDESAAADVDPAAERLACSRIRGLPFTIGFVDGVMRPESLSAAAANLQRVAPLVPQFLPWYLRAAVRTAGAVGPILPAPTVPIAQSAARDGRAPHRRCPARQAGPALTAIRESGARLNLNLLGEAVLGEAEALRRLEGIHDLIRRDDVDYVSVKVSAIASHISMWAFDEVVDRVVDRLLPLYLTAASSAGPESAQTFINLDMEEYRDLDLTIAVFTRLLEDPRLRDLEAGIVLQAYLPDALPALRQLTAWAQQRVDGGGARIKVRLVKGANLAMERVDAVMHGWPLATHASKLDADASYLRCLDEALRPENSRAVRLGVAGHNLFDIAYAWLLAGERGVRDDVEFEMLLGMAQGQVAAVSREVGHVLLYVPVVRPDEFDVAISYLVRRLEENASSDNFLSAAFDLADDPAMFARSATASSPRCSGPPTPPFPSVLSGRRRGGTTRPPRRTPALTRPGPPRNGGGRRRRRSDAGGARHRRRTGDGESFVDTAVFDLRESVRAEGAPGSRTRPTPRCRPTAPGPTRSGADRRVDAPESRPSPPRASTTRHRSKRRSRACAPPAAVGRCARG
jgi:RHH-type proline utilization regulon transcriptional repressor/proline dehydrogenase/delta 1-pyrroline-5-carboxylate dehydrogenase